MLGRSALLAATNSENYGNWLGNYSDVSLLLRGATTTTVANPPLDESPTPKTITTVGSATITTAQFRYGDSSLNFDGTNSMFVASSSTDFDLAGVDWTIEFWIRPTAFADFQSPLTQALYQWRIDIVSGVPRFYTEPIFTSNTALTLNIWQHLAITSSGGTGRMFINGVKTAEGPVSLSSSGASQMRIGALAFGSFYYPMTGQLDDVRITKGIARYVEGTGANVNKMVFAGTNDFADPNNFGELQTNSGPNPDPSWNSVSLLLRNGTPSSTLIPFDESPIATRKTITAFGNAGISTTIFKYGTSSLVFDGTGDYFKVSDSNDFLFGTGDFTIECWIYKTATAQSTILANLIDAGAGSDIWIYVNSNNAVVTSTWNTVLSTSASNVVSNGNWFHIAWTRAGTTALIFVNGEIVNTYPLSTNFVRNTGPTIGAYGAGNAPFAGYIDDIRITRNFARYTSNFTPPPAELPNF